MGQNEGRQSDFWDLISRKWADGATWLWTHIILQEKGRISLIMLQRPERLPLSLPPRVEVFFSDPEGRAVAQDQGKGWHPHPDGDILQDTASRHRIIPKP